MDQVHLNTERKRPLRATIVVQNPNGLHMRPAMGFASLAKRFRAVVTVRRQDRMADGKSGMQMMLLAAMPGAELVLEVDGEEAEQAFPVLSRALGSSSPDALDELLR